MTGIAWDGKTIAVDKGVFNNDNIAQVTKLHPITFKGKKAVYAACGSSAYCAKILEYIDDNNFNNLFRGGWTCQSVIHQPMGIPQRVEFKIVPEEDYDACFGLILTEDRKVYKIYGNGTISEIEGDVCTEGSAFEFLAGAIRGGKTAVEAIELAIKYRGDCANGVNYASFDDLTIKTKM